jgi:hypothetical protein
LLGTLGVSSFLLAIWVAGVNPSYSFYLFPTRAWELLVGATLALALKLNHSPTPRVAFLASSLGILMIGVSYLYLGNIITENGALALVPVFGAALVIYGGSARNFISKALGSPPLVGLGLISYSLYLWHYPILAFGSVTVPLGVKGEVFAVALAVLLAIASLKLVETPFRQARTVKVYVFLLLTSFVILISFVSGSIWTSGYGETRSSRPIASAVIQTSEHWDINNVLDGKGNFILFGDSHMMMLAPGLSEKVGKLRYSFLNGTQTGCPMLLGLDLINSDIKNCDANFQNERLNWAAKSGKSIVIFGGRFPLWIEQSGFDNRQGGVDHDSADFVARGNTTRNPDNQKAVVQGSLRETLVALLKQGHTLVLVYPIPEVGWGVPAETSRRAMLPQNLVSTGLVFPTAINERLVYQSGTWPLVNPVTTSYALYEERTESTFEVYDSIISDRVIRIYPHEIFCVPLENGRCLTSSESSIFYSDHSHLSSQGASLLVNEILLKTSTLTD